jgi:hypothetical protein
MNVVATGKSKAVVGLIAWISGACLLQARRARRIGGQGIGSESESALMVGMMSTRSMSARYPEAREGLLTYSGASTSTTAPLP